MILPGSTSFKDLKKRVGEYWRGSSLSLYSQTVTDECGLLWKRGWARLTQYLFAYTVGDWRFRLSIHVSITLGKEPGGPHE